MKKYIYVITGAVAMLAASCGRTVNPGKTLKTGIDSFSYSLGINVGNYLKQQGLDKIDYSSLIKGIEDKLKKDSGYAVSEADMEKIGRSYVLKEQSKKIKVLQEESKKWMQENATKAGIKPLSTGGQIRVITPGNGAAPQLYDTVEYTMIMKNSAGKELMNSSKMGGPRKHPLKQIGLTQLEEAFQKAGMGAEFEVFLQNDLVPELAQSAQSFSDKYGITILSFKILNVKPGKPEAEKPAGKGDMPPEMK